ncbi:MAG: hypothetical protein LUI61_01025, partial [Firmicutes bacterium]|nr:hypothetical protein [Bacillota bacterium]
RVPVLFVSFILSSLMKDFCICDFSHEKCTAFRRASVVFSVFSRRLPPPSKPQHFQYTNLFEHFSALLSKLFIPNKKGLSSESPSLCVI